MIREQREQVRFILEAYPDTRNSDIELNFKKMEQFEGVYYTDAQKDMIRRFMKNWLGVERARRKIQEENEDLRATDPKVRRGRKEKEAEVREEVGVITKENVQVIIDAKEIEKTQAKMFDIKPQY